VKLFSGVLAVLVTALMSIGVFAITAAAMEEDSSAVLEMVARDMAQSAPNSDLACQRDQRREEGWQKIANDVC
jgi:hypothetical protein